MKLLAIDTSTDIASIALYHQQKFQSKEQTAQRQHAQCVIPMINELLVEAQLSIGQLDGIIFGRGPGSFTGLRIACSVAKGLAYAHDLPLFPVSSLEAIAAGISQQTTQENLGILALIDARMNQVYWACYHSSYGEREQVSDAKAVMIPDNFPIWLAGVGYKTYTEQFSSSIRSRIQGETEVYPSAANMIRLVLEKHIQPVSVEQALPVYLRNQVVQGGVHG